MIEVTGDSTRARRVGLRAARGRRRPDRGCRRRGSRPLARRPDAARGGCRRRGAPGRRRAGQRDRADLRCGAGAGAGCSGDERRCRQRGRAPAGRSGGDRRHPSALDRPRGAGLRTRLLLTRSGDRRPGDLSRARHPARHARRTRGLPPRDRPSVRRGLRARRDAESLYALQRELPLRAAALRSRAAPELRDSRPATTRASSSIAAGNCSPARRTRTRTSRTCSPASIHGISIASGSRSVSRPRRRRGPRPSVPGSPVARRAESQEACFLGGGDYRDFLERHGLPAREGRIVNEAGATVGTTPGSGGSRRASGAASASSTGQPSYALRSDPGDEHGRRRPARGARAPHGRRPRASCSPP